MEGFNLPPGCNSADGYTQEQAERAAVMEQEGFPLAAMERFCEAVSNMVSEWRDRVEAGGTLLHGQLWLWDMYREAERAEIEARLEPPERN